MFWHFQKNETKQKKIRWKNPTTVCSFQYIPRGFSSVPEDLEAMMDLGAFQPAIAMIFHVESEFAIENAGFLRPDPEKYRIFSRTFPEQFRKNSFQYIPSEQPVCGNMVPQKPPRFQPT